MRRPDADQIVAAPAEDLSERQVVPVARDAEDGDLREARVSAYMGAGLGGAGRVHPEQDRERIAVRELGRHLLALPDHRRLY